MCVGTRLRYLCKCEDYHHGSKCDKASCQKQCSFPTYELQENCVKHMNTLQVEQWKQKNAMLKVPSEIHSVTAKLDRLLEISERQSTSESSIPTPKPTHGFKRLPGTEKKRLPQTQQRPVVNFLTSSPHERAIVRDIVDTEINNLYEELQVHKGKLLNHLEESCDSVMITEEGVALVKRLHELMDVQINASCGKAKDAILRSAYEHAEESDSSGGEERGEGDEEMDEYEDGEPSYHIDEGIDMTCVDEKIVWR